MNYTGQKNDYVLYFCWGCYRWRGGLPNFVKRVPNSINPIVSVIAMYVAVLAMGVALLTLFPTDGSLLHHFRQLSWIQLALAVSVIMIGLGFLLMYRYGWNLSSGNLVTGVVVNLILVGLGVILLGEKVNVVNGIGFVFCILGVALISYRS